jgi:hypothetical protein
MGLTAVVFNTKKNILDKYKIDNKALVVDDETGEVYFSENFPQNVNIEFENILAEEHLGNISNIQLLFNELKKILSHTSTIISKILYNWTYSGDIIQSTALQRIREEINYLNTHINPNNKQKK